MKHRFVLQVFCKYSKYIRDCRRHYLFLSISSGIALILANDGQSLFIPFTISTMNNDFQTDIIITFVYNFAFKLAMQVYLHLLIATRLSLGLVSVV